MIQPHPRNLNQFPPRRCCSATYRRGACWKLILAIVFFAAAAATCLMFGCQGKTVSAYKGSTTITLADGTVIRRDAESKGSVVTPSNASGPSTLSTTDAGVVSEVSGSWQATAINYTKKNTWVFYVAAVVFLGGGVFCFVYLQQHVLGVCFAGCSAICTFAPTLIDTLGVWIAVGVGVVLLIGVVYVIARFVFHVDLKAKAAPVIAKLHKEGNAAAAMALTRMTDPGVDAAFKATPTAQPAGGVTAVQPTTQPTTQPSK